MGITVDTFGYTEVKDSGKREEHASGAVRDTREGKGRFDLISPIALKRLAVHMENGVKKYGDRNWEKGLPVMRFLDSAIRHTYEYIEGDRSEDHLAAAMWNIHSAIHTEEMVRRGMLPLMLNDVPDPGLSAQPFPLVNKKEAECGSAAALHGEVLKEALETEIEKDVMS